MGRDGIISRIAVARDDAVVAVKRRLVVGEVGFAADNQALVLQKVDDGVALCRRGVGPLVELLGHVDEDDGRGHPDVEVGVVGEEEASQAKGRRRLANLVDVVAHLAIGDGPRELVVSLRRRIASKRRPSIRGPTLHPRGPFPPKSFALSHSSRNGSRSRGTGQEMEIQQRKNASCFTRVSNNKVDLLGGRQRRSGRVGENCSEAPLLHLWLLGSRVLAKKGCGTEGHAHLECFNLSSEDRSVLVPIIVH